MHQQNQQQTPETFEPTPPSTLPATALTSLNALAHGGASKRLFIPGEVPADFFTLIDDAFAHHQPATAQDSDLVKDSVLARWFLSRCQRAYINGEHEVYKQKPNITDWTNEDFHRLTLLDRYKTQAERALRRALVNVNAIRKDAVRLEIWQLNRDRLKIKYAKEAQEHEEAELQRNLFKKEPRVTLHKTYGSLIKQNAYISIKNGQTVIESLYPSNKTVQDILATAGELPAPPQHILRNFHFENNVPSEYEFLYDENDFPNPQPEDDCETSYLLSLEEWQDLADTEAEIIANQPIKLKTSN